MKEYWVSFHTAIALKRSDFKPPIPNAGQFWYSAHGRLVVISEVGDKLVLQSGPTNQTAFFPKDNPPSGEDAYYAPTATDIINQMPAPENVSVSGGKVFTCFVKTEDGIKTYMDTNPAEACAKAWYDIHPLVE